MSGEFTIESGNMELWKIPIKELIPQREPFIMISHLHKVDKYDTAATLLIDPDNIFVENGYLTAPGIMEFMAQTCAARMGYAARFMEGGEVQIGFIGGVDNLTVRKFPKAGMEIACVTHICAEIGSMKLMEAIVFLNNEILATARLKTALQNN